MVDEERKKLELSGGKAPKKEPDKKAPKKKKEKKSKSLGFPDKVFVSTLWLVHNAML